jgi:NADH-quinone oxidoreductase subunit M
VIAATGVIFAAAYLLWAIQRVLFNPLDKPENARLPDLNWRELAILTPLIAMVFWLGLYPAPVLRRTELSARALVEFVSGRAVTATRVATLGTRDQGTRGPGTTD